MAAANPVESKDDVLAGDLHKSAPVVAHVEAEEGEVEQERKRKRKTREPRSSGTGGDYVVKHVKLRTLASSNAASC